MKIINSPTYFIWIISILTTMLGGCDAPSQEETQQKIEEEIGTNASILASFVVSASRSCSIIGINDINECTNIKGTLSDERMAKMLADTATSQAKDYLNNCQLHFEVEYCTKLANRALDIERRKSKITEHGN